MREIHVSKIINTVKNLVIDANLNLPIALEECISFSYEVENQPLAKSIFSDMIENLNIAKEKHIPICQDTGLAVIFADIGQDLHIIGGDFEDAINEGVRQGYNEGYLRKSIVKDPLLRENTGDNTPAVIHTRIVKGESLSLSISPKGFGSENMSQLKMLLPSSSKQDIIDFVVDVVSSAGGNPCPPIIVGVGIGGNFESSAILAKRALCRDINIRNTNEYYANLELEMLNKINKLNIGPQGFGGKTTAFAVNIEQAPTHIAGLPVAVNISCHVTRHKNTVI